MRRVILGGLLVCLLLPLVGCTTVATMAVKHVAMKEGMNVAKSAYKGLKGEPADQKKTPAAPPQRSVVIASTPPGARIEVNGKRIGDAPVVFVMKQQPDGSVARDYRIKATPVEPGQVPRETRFLHYKGEPGDRAPARITFHMDGPASQPVTISHE